MHFQGAFGNLRCIFCLRTTYTPSGVYHDIVPSCTLGLPSRRQQILVGLR